MNETTGYPTYQKPDQHHHDPFGGAMRLLNSDFKLLRNDILLQAAAADCNEPVKPSAECQKHG
jgi:hypothetical protein